MKRENLLGEIFKSEKHQLFIRKILLIITDIILVNLSYYFSLLLRFDANIPSEYISLYLNNSLKITIIAILSFSIFRLYKSLWRYASIDELISVVIANIVASSLTFTILTLMNVNFPKSIYLIALLLNIAFVGGLRFGYRVLRNIKNKFTKNGFKKDRVLIIGGGSAGSIVIKEIKESDHLNKDIIGIIDDDKRKIGKRIHNVPILGTREDIINIAKKEKVDEIILAIPSAPKKEIKNILEICKETKCKIRTLPGVYELIDGKISIKKIRDVEIEDLLGREPVKIDLNEIGQYLENQVVLVTGGGGSIGSELCRQIARFNPKKLLILDMYENNAYDIQNELKRKYGDKLNQEVIIANIRERKRLEKVFEKYHPDLIFHAAAYKHVPLMEENPTEAIKNNVFGTLNLVELADEYNVKRFVLISTDKAVNPTNVMGASKRIAEKIIQAMNTSSKTEYVAVRFGNVLGSNGSVIPLFKKQITEGGPVTVTHPEVIRYFMTIPEAVQLVLQAGAMAKGGEIFVLDMGEPVKILDLAKDLIKLSGFEPGKDIEIKFTGLRPGEKLYEELLLAEEGLKATKNEKIFIVKPIFEDIKTLKNKLDKIKNLLEHEDFSLIESIIKELVPTYKKLDYEKINSEINEKAI